LPTITIHFHGEKVDFPLARVSFDRTNKYGLEKESAAERKRKGREKSKGEKERRKECKTYVNEKGKGRVNGD